jgi:hypothetical protein
MAYIGKQPLVGNYISCDSLSASATTTYNLASSGTPVFPTVPQNCIVSLNGVVQAPVTSFTISGSAIVFSTTLSTTDSIDYITVLGNTLNIGTPSNNTVGLSQLSATGTPSATTFLRGDNSWATPGADLVWQSVQTTSFTAVAARAYPVNTTSAGITVTLPATPTAGDQVQIVDYAGTWDTNNLTINPNGNKILAQTSNVIASKDREAITLTYIDATQGWLPSSGYQESTQGLGIPYSIDFLVIAGGGGGCAGAGNEGSGGGGAGGYRTSTQTVTGGTVITVTVGDGGAGSVGGVNTNATSGSNSSISGSGLTTITSAGGGGGARGNGPSGQQGLSGGSGGGSGGYFNSAGGVGNTPSTSPSQGNNGGSGSPSPNTPNQGGGGGGGANAVGLNGTSTTGGNGGDGTASSITGSSVTRAGGGGGGTNGGTAGAGGNGGGGAGSTGGTATAGTVNLGGGGGGNGATANGASGGKGVVILSMATGSYSGTTTGSPTVTTSGGNTILQFNGDGSYTA